MTQNGNLSPDNWILEKHFIGTFDDPDSSDKYKTEMCHVECRRCGTHQTIPYNTHEEVKCECAAMTKQQFQYHQKRLEKMKIPSIKPAKKTFKMKKAS